MTIKQWPSGERPREKLLQRGAEALSDAELLAIFLRTGVAGKSAVALARELIDRCGGLRALLAAGKDELCQSPGIGEAKYVQLQAALEVGRRVLKERLQRGEPLTSPRLVEDYLRHQLQDRQQEVFSVIYLDNRHRVIDYEELFLGTIDGASVHPREVVKKALQRNAAALIVAHNHPSGVAEPSSHDTAVTLRLKEALKLVDVRLLDHLVVGDGECISLQERGLI
ncbi:MAG: DNA repair protein RadC [Pseudomonadota bacterium]|nr:DNA repair protein RadC [Pseudomonadota bacterium]